MNDEEFQKLCDGFQSLGIEGHAPFVPEMTVPDLEILEARDFHAADYAYEVIMERIKEFEDELDDEHEIALKLASFGQSVTLAVTEILYSNPDTLIFYGFVGDQKAALIQNKSQLNFLLLAVPKHDPKKPPRRIGFIAGREEANSTSL